MDKVLENRIYLLIREMTLEEKTGMIHGAGLFRTAGVERLHIPPLKMSDGPMGVRSEFVNDQWMPVGTPDDYVTYCPSNSAIAMTWNRKLAHNAGKVLGEEARGRGKDVILAPGINIKRTPACGRNFEYISEDPRLTSELAVPMVRGIETSDVAACVKHFAMNNQETERLWINVEADERTMREIYFPAFQAVVQKAGAKSIMGSYNLIRGTHVCENKDIMGTVLRKEWGFDGTIISDWGAVHTTKETAEGPLDIEMSVTSDFDDYFLANPLISEIRKGHIDEACVDEKVRNILRMMVRLHMIELTEVPDSDGKKKILVQKNKNRKAGSYNTAKHRSEVLKVARESITLLKNEDRKLPLDPAIDKVLVIGQNAVISQAMGGGSAEIKALYEITPLLGISKFLGGNCEVRYARGYDIPAKKESDHNWQEDSLDASKAAAETAKETEDSARLRKEAVELAKEYKHVIYVGGLNHDQDLEGQDRADLTLPYGQDRLITELLEVRSDMTIVMLAGSPVSMKPWADRAKAIVWMSYSGMEGGTALAEVLFGAVNPSGKLAETLPEEIPECFRKEAYFPGTARARYAEAPLCHRLSGKGHGRGRCGRRGVFDVRQCGRGAAPHPEDRVRRRAVAHHAGTQKRAGRAGQRDDDGVRRGRHRRFGQGCPARGGKARQALAHTASAVRDASAAARGDGRHALRRGKGRGKRPHAHKGRRARPRGAPRRDRPPKRGRPPERDDALRS